MAQQKSHKKVIIIGSIVAVIMFLFCFSIVPLYGLICRTAGINSTASNKQVLAPITAEEANDKSIDKTREITVQFIVTNHMGLPWDFYPAVKSIKVHPGENAKVIFHAKNTTHKTMTMQAIPGMTPAESIGHFHKIECFCFNQQTLKGGQRKDMPLIFKVDKNLPKEIHVVTLSYTLFDVTSDAKQETKKG